MNCPTFIFFFFFFSRASQTWKETQQRVPDLYQIIQNTDFQIELVLQASPNIKKKAIKIKGYLKMFTELKYINYCSRCRIFMRLNPQKSTKFSVFALICPSSISSTFKWDTIPGGLNLGRGANGSGCLLGHHFLSLEHHLFPGEGPMPGQDQLLDQPIHQVGAAEEQGMAGKGGKAEMDGSGEVIRK